MRWRLLVGFGVAGAVTGSALGQFAVDRVPPAAPASSPMQPSSTPLVPPGLQPVAPSAGTAYTPPVSGVMPAGGIAPATGANGTPSLVSLASLAPSRTITTPPAIEIESALGKDHPWAIKAEHGAYFICVKSYSRPHTPTPDDKGPSALALAQALASDIRKLHRVQAFLYEYISDERKAEAAALAAERERGRIFSQQMDEYKKKCELNNMIFLEPDNKIRYKTVNYRDQIAVLVGGFKSDSDAREALNELKKWPAPQEKILMDGVVAAHYTTDKNTHIENGYINPYKSATVVTNPLIPRPVQQASTHLDPFLVKINSDNPYNLLKATKDWTLAVKAFNPPIEIVSKDADTTQKPSIQKFSFFNKGANALLASAAQAEALAKVLRDMKGPGGQKLGLEAFVLHTRHNSIVTVGQFEGPNDPALVQTQNLLLSMRLNVTKDEMGSKPITTSPKLLDDKFIPMPIPKP